MRRKFRSSLRRIHRISPALHHVFVKGVFYESRSVHRGIETRRIGFVVSEKWCGFAFVSKSIFAELIVLRAHDTIAFQL